MTIVFWLTAPSAQQDVVQDRGSPIVGCTKTHFDIIMNVYTYVCIVYIGRQALY